MSRSIMRKHDNKRSSSLDSIREKTTDHYKIIDNLDKRDRQKNERRTNTSDMSNVMDSYGHYDGSKSSETFHLKKDIQKNNEEVEDSNKNESKEKQNFNPSGLLAQDKNYKNGVELKYIESLDAAIPDKKWRLYVFLNVNTKDPTEILHIHRKSCYLIGKDDLVVDIKLANPTISKQHAVIQFKKHENKVLPFLLDLNSTNGSYLNNEKIDPNKFYELRETDILRFGNSAREYVLLHDSSENDTHI